MIWDLYSFAAYLGSWLTEQRVGELVRALGSMLWQSIMNRAIKRFGDCLSKLPEQYSFHSVHNPPYRVEPIPTSLLLRQAKKDARSRFSLEGGSK